jgi:hypothetical protein
MCDLDIDIDTTESSIVSSDRIHFGTRLIKIGLENAQATMLLRFDSRLYIVFCY